MKEQLPPNNSNLLVGKSKEVQVTYIRSSNFFFSKKIIENQEMSKWDGKECKVYHVHMSLQGQQEIN